MRYIWTHINTIIQNYNGAIPLSHYLKNFYRLHPKLGSRDRKMISEMAYCWYRCSKGFPDELTVEEKIIACLFLCESSTQHTDRFLPERWLDKKMLSLEERVHMLNKEGIPFNVQDLVSFSPDLSNGIDTTSWLWSILHQPKLFIRIREKRELIEQILKENRIPHSFVSANCIALPNGTAIDKLLPEKAYVVQDASSQETGNYFHPTENESWWDCCCGAGGKSLLLMERMPSVRLTVSDKRTSILHNLSDRFKLYKLKEPEQFVLDVTNNEELERTLGDRTFDNIICDAPCSGSGTWARTPEQLYFFKESYTRDFAQRQKEITANVTTYLKPGGRLYYITCSVFRQENEDVTSNLVKQGMSLEEQELINGISKDADSMFVAVPKK